MNVLLQIANKLGLSLTTTKKNWGVLHPAAHALARLSGKPFFATTVQGVYCIAVEV
jgi:hypothetical protein